MSISTRKSLSGSAGGSDWFLTVLMVSVFQPIVNQMRQKAKKYLITTATSEIFIVRINRIQPIRGFCQTCEKRNEMLTLDAAVSVSGITALGILRLIETGKIHVLETANGHLLICEKSVLNAKIEQ